MFAARHNAVDVAELLITHGADVNAKNAWSMTALMYTVWNNNAPNIARLLIEAGADVNAKDYQGNTALMFAEESHSTDVIALLKAAGTKE